MADFTKRIIFIILYWICEIGITSAHYCEWGVCNPREYCCAPNKCCPKAETNPNEAFYRIAYVLAGLMLAVLLFFALRHKILPYRLFSNRSADAIPLKI